MKSAVAILAGNTAPTPRPIPFGRRLCAASTVAAAALLVFSSPVLAAPQGGNVVSGAATIGQSGNTTNINQSSGRVIINWQSFGIAANETVNFYQPSASAVALNRVIGNERSIIDGALNANGQVFLVNSAGVLIGKGGSVNTAGFVASTLGIKDADFNAGKYTFAASGPVGDAVNLGTITATAGGTVALLGKTVSNQGTIIATKGTVALAGGNKITLNYNGDSLISVSVDEGVLNALVENHQAIQADGGRVILTAKAADDLLSAQVNNDGLIQARSIDDLKGSIQLFAHGGTTNVAGTLDASASASGDGGFVETSGDRVKIADNAVITTKSTNGRNGTWLIDPTDFTIVSGSGVQTSSGIGATTLGTNLANGNVTLQTAAGGSGNGDINVNAAVSWDAANTLTLTAASNINIDGAITAQYSAYSSASPTIKAGLTLNAGNNIYVNNAVSLTNATLAVNYGGYNGTTVTTAASGTDYSIRTNSSYAGTTSDGTAAQSNTSGGTYGSIAFNGGSSGGDGLKINGNTYTLIASMSDLAGATGTGKYALATDLSANGSTYNAAVLSTLNGTLAGLGHTVSNLTMSSTSSSYLGLIGQSASGTVIRDIAVVNTNISATNAVATGALIGYSLGNISGAYSTGTVSGAANVGGLIGNSNGSSTTLANSYSNAAVSGSSGTGGLIGRATTLAIQNSNSTGSVTANASSASGIGGLLGLSYGTSVSYSYATGTVSVANGVSSVSKVGGLIGSVQNSGTSPMDVLYSFSTGAVTGGTYVGGLVGYLYSTTKAVTIDHSYHTTGTVTSTGASSAGEGTGGLLGGIGSSGQAYGTTISNSYATSDVTNTSTGRYVGGVVGYLTSKSASFSNAISSSYATGNVSSGGNYVGGLAGSASNTNITGSHSAGSVSGNQYVGGLLGSGSGSITNSYTSSAATGSAFTGANGPAGPGGLIGSGNFTIANTYWNNSANTYGQGNSQSAQIGTGLTGTQVADARYYANGTIDQVLATRAVQAAAATKTKNDAVSSANSVVAAVTSSRPPPPAEISANGAVAPTQPSVSDRISIDNSSSYSADIKSIEVDGVRYNVEGPAPTASSNQSDDRQK